MRLAVLLAIDVLGHEARDAIGVEDGVGGVAEGQGGAAAGLGVVLGLQLGEALGVVEVVGERDVGRQVGAGVERAAALAAVEGRREGVLVHPVGAGGGARQARGDAVACAVDAVFGVQVDFRHDARHVDAAVVAHAAGLVLRDDEVGEPLGGDLVLADGTVAGRVVVSDVAGVRCAGGEAYYRSAESLKML